MEKITDSFTKSLVVNSADLIENYAELGIDLLIDNDILKEIPIVNTLMGSAKVIKTIYDRNCIKNLIQFINEINTGGIDKKKLNNYQNELFSNPKKAENELGRVLLIISSNIDSEKNIMIGRLFKAYVNFELSWDEFCELTEVVRRLFIQDIPLLLGIYHGELKKSKIAYEMYRLDRIQSLGITGTSPDAFTAPARELDDNFYLVPNKIGKKFMRIVFDGGSNGESN